MVALAPRFSSYAPAVDGVSADETATATLRRGLMLEPRDGIYAQIPACRPEHALYALEVALSFPEVDAQRRSKGAPGAQTVLTFARLWAAAADHNTGRGIAISHQRIAAETGYKYRTVKNTARFLAALGFLVEVARGRNMLSRKEKAQAAAGGAPRQTAVASTRALTIPKAVYGRPLPLSGKVKRTSHVKKNSPKPTCRRPDAAPRPSSRKKQPSAPRTFPLPMYKLASDLINALPRLLWTTKTQPHRSVVTAPGGRIEAIWSGGRHIGHICDALQRWNLLQNGWTAAEILKRVTAYTVTARISEPPRDELRDPLAWFVALIRRAIGQHEPAPAIIATHERQQRLNETHARRQADAEARSRAEAGRAESAAIIAAMWEQLPSRAGQQTTPDIN